MRLARLAALLEDLHDDCRRGEGEAHGADEGRCRRQPDKQSDAGQQRAADQHLGDAEAEDGMAERPQPRRLQFEPDDEEEEDDAELGDVEDRTRLAEEAEAEGPDDDAGDEIADDRAEADALEDRHGDDARTEQHDRLEEVGSRACVRHSAPVAP